MKNKQTLKRAGRILLIVAILLVVGALLLGVLNGLVADGKWSFGWQDYRYDDSGYTVGEGTLPAPDVTELSIDWMDGGVAILPCDDAYLSVSEETDTELAEKLKLRWKISEDGHTVSIKYRASSWFFGKGADKRLVVRIPKRLFGQLTSLSVSGKSAIVMAEDLQIPTVNVQTVTGSVQAKGCTAQTISLASKNGNVLWESELCPNSATISTESGKVSLAFSKEPSCVLLWQTERGGLVSDFSMTQEEDGRYLCGDAQNHLSVSTKNGDLELKSLSN